MKKVLSLLICTLIIFTLFAGCNNSSKTSNESSNTYSATGGTTDLSAKGDIKPITFTMFLGEVNPYADNFESPVAKEITKRTGVTLQIEYLVSGDEKQKLSLMAASGEYPDLVYAKSNTRILKDVDALYKLDDMIEKNGDNIKKFYGDQIKRLQYSMEDKSIYFLGGKEFANENMEPNSGFQLQHAVVKELGYPRIKTLQDFENAIKTYKEKYPTIDGQKTIGMSLLADDWRFLITVSNPACFATGGSDDGEWYVDQENLSVIRHLLRPEEKEYFRWLNHMNDIGLLDPESFVQKYDQYKAKVSSGRILALADSRWELLEPVAALQQAGKLERMYGYYPLTMDESIKNAEFMSTGYVGGWGISITKKCKDVERAFKFLDWFHSEEAQILIHWGVEGVHYDIVDGKRVMKPEIIEMKAADPAFQKKTGIINYCYPFPTYGNTVKDSTGQYFEAFNTLEEIKVRQTSIENEVLKAYGVTAWKELYPQSTEFSKKPYGAGWLMNIDDPDWQAKNTAILNTGYKMIPAAILATPGEFDEMWDKYVKAIKDAGVDDITVDFEKALKDKVEMWK